MGPAAIIGWGLAEIAAIFGGGDNDGLGDIGSNYGGGSDSNDGFGDSPGW